MEWLTVGQLVKKTQLPESTVRRYITRLPEFFAAKEYKHVTKYHPESVRVLLRAYDLYSEGLATEEVKEYLSGEFSKYIDADEPEDYHPTTTPPHHPTTIEESPALQELYNKLSGRIEDLETTVREQQKFINERLEKRDQELLQGIRKLQEQKKPWWKRLFRKE